MNLSSEALALLASVRDNHADDTPRLILADYLDERGTPEAAARAEFIRCQIELAAVGHRIANDLSVTYTELHAREQELRRREQQVWTRISLEWLDCFGEWFCCALNPEGACNKSLHGFPARGFLSRIRCSWADASQHLDSILADPWVPGLDEVELTTWPDVMDLYRLNGGDSPGNLIERHKEIISRRWTYTIDGKTVPAVRSWKLPPEPRADDWRPQRAPQLWQNEWPADYEGHDLINPGGRDER